MPGTINIPLNKSFTTWAGALLSYDDAFSIIVDEQCPACIDEAAHGARDVQVVDVRGASEWSAGHIPDVPNIPAMTSRVPAMHALDTTSPT